MTHVFFESTGQYWVPLFNSFSDSDLTLVLANPQYMKNVAGRKTDMKDTEWIAQLGRCGLIALSYIPSSKVMQLRLLIRRVRSYKQRQTQVKNEMYNLLQRANIKLTSYLSDVFLKTGQVLLALFINWMVIDSESISSCIQIYIKETPEELVEAMNGKLSVEDRFLLNQILEEYRMYQELIEKLTSEIQTSVSGIAKDFP